MMMNMVDYNTYNYKEVFTMSTPEKNTEELLYKSHSLGIAQDVFSLSKQLRENDKTLDFDCAIEKAYSHLTK
jgi:hypothetical protein